MLLLSLKHIHSQARPFICSGWFALASSLCLCPRSIPILYIAIDQDFYILFWHFLLCKPKLFFHSISLAVALGKNGAPAAFK
jgi:hypothetical protein